MEHISAVSLVAAFLPAGQQKCFELPRKKKKKVVNVLMV